MPAIDRSSGVGPYHESQRSGGHTYVGPGVPGPMSASETRGCRHIFRSGLLPGKPGPAHKIATRLFAPRWSATHGFEHSRPEKLLSNPCILEHPFSVHNHFL